MGLRLSAAGIFLLGAAGLLLHSTLLDRSRPLWEFFVIDGLKSGQVALYCKVHHSGIDGQGGVAWRGVEVTVE